MFKPLIIPAALTTACFAVLAAPSQGQTVIWDIDFDALEAGPPIPGTNISVGGTEFSPRNEATAQIVDVAATPEINGVGGFSGNAALISIGPNAFSSFASFSNPLTFEALDPTDTFTFSFDLFVNTDTVVEFGGFQPRLEAPGTAGNGPTLTPEGGPISTAGFHSVVVTGLVSDIANGDGPLTAARPFFFIDQDGTAVDDFIFVDNISFVVGSEPVPVPEPGSLGLLGLGAAAVLGRRRA